MRSALVIADLQNDFCPGGSLGVAGGDELAAPLSRLARQFIASGQEVFVTRDWHPPVTKHFAAEGGRWPPHCVQGTRGAEFHRDLSIPAGAVIVSKGTDPNADGYSAFDAIDGAGRPLGDLLRNAGVGEVVLAGIATDYCVRASGLDALREGFHVNVLADGVRAVDPVDGERSLAELERAGASILTLDQIAARFPTTEEEHP